MPPITFSDVFYILASLALGAVCIYAVVGLHQSMKETLADDK